MRIVNIPKNFADNGGFLGGMIKKKNGIEAGIFLGISLAILRLLIGKVHVAVIISIFIIICVPITLLLVVGINGQSTLTVLTNCIVYKKYKTVATLKMPEVLLGDEDQLKKKKFGRIKK